MIRLHDDCLVFEMSNGDKIPCSASTVTVELMGSAVDLLDRETVERLNAFAVSGCVPDITFVLDVDAMTAESRMPKPRRADRMEQQPAEFYERVRQAYRELAKRESNRIVLIDGFRNADDVEHEIWETISSRFPALTKGPQSAIRSPQS